MVGLLSAPSAPGLVAAFGAHLVALGRSAGTVSAYGADLERFRSWLVGGRPGEPDWSSLSAGALGAFFAAERAWGRSPATLARRAATLRAFLRFAGIEALVRAVPRVRVTAPRRPTPTEVEIGRIAAAAASGGDAAALRDGAIVALLAGAGLRPGELVALDLGDLESGIGAGGMPGRRAGTRPDSSSRPDQCPSGSPVAPADRRTLAAAGFALLRVGQRCVELEPVAERGLAAYLAEGRPVLARPWSDGALFLNHRGQRMSRQGAWLRLGGHAAAAGVPGAGPGALRRSCARRLLAEGRAPQDVARLLGCWSTSWLAQLGSEAG